MVPEQNNWAGIKTDDAAGDRPEDHETFDSPEEGVRAHFNHLCAYVGMNPIGEPHDRYLIVVSLSWAGTIKFVEELSTRWAPSPEYGGSVTDYMEDLLNTSTPVGLSEDERFAGMDDRITRLESKLADIGSILKED